MSYKRLIAITLMAAPLLACQQRAAPTQSAASASASASTVPVHAAVCTGERAFGELKRIVFEQAAAAGSGQTRAALADLAGRASLKVDMPVLDSYDDATMKADCSGRLHVTVPAGAVRGIDGPDLLADARYTAQPAADGSGTVYRLDGGEDVVSALARAGLAEDASRVGPQAQTAAPAVAEAAAPVRHARPHRIIARSEPVVNRHSDDYVCEHGDPQSDLTIDACFRRDHAGPDGDY